MSENKNQKVNEKITKLIQQTGKTKSQLAKKIDVKVNTLRVWFVKGIFPEQFKKDLAEFVGQPVEAIEAIGFRFFKDDKPRSRFNPGEVSERNIVNTKNNETGLQTDDTHLVLMLAKLILRGEIETVSREEFIYLSLFVHENRQPASPDELKGELARVRAYFKK